MLFAVSSVSPSAISGKFSTVHFHFLWLHFIGVFGCGRADHPMPGLVFHLFFR